MVVKQETARWSVQHEIPFQTLVFFGLVWLVGFLTCFARTIRDAEFRDAWHVLSLSVCAGFLCFGVCAVSDGFGAVRLVGPSGWLGISALLGLLAKEQNNIGKAVLMRALFKTKDVLELFNEEIEKKAENKQDDPDERTE